VGRAFHLHPHNKANLKTTLHFSKVQQKNKTFLAIASGSSLSLRKFPCYRIRTELGFGICNRSGNQFMKPIRLPEPPSPTMGVPEIFENGAYSVIRRAVVIGNGFPGSENQSLGLVRALGLYDKHVLFVSSLLSFSTP